MENTFSQKTRLIKKLAENGIKTEREVKAIQFSDIKNLKLTNNEIIVLCDLQEQIKKGKLYSFLVQDEDDRGSTEMVSPSGVYKTNNNQAEENTKNSINWKEEI